MNQECYKDMFNFSQILATVGLPVSEEYGDAILPFKITSPQDMASFWKKLDEDSACKSKKLCCHCCTCNGDKCANYKIGNLWCKR